MPFSLLCLRQPLLVSPFKTSIDLQHQKNLGFFKQQKLGSSHARIRQSVAVRCSSNLPPFHDLQGGGDMVLELFGRAEGLLYTIADAAVNASNASSDVAKANRDWFSGITDCLEAVLKILKDGLSALHVPYAYGFAIILLTVLVKAATFPLTKKQVESAMAMRSLQPQIKAIQELYSGDQERIKSETVRLYKLAGVNPLAETLAIKFTGKNYAAWEFQFRMFLKGKELWNHIDGSAPTPKEGTELSQWEAKDARIISWILGSIEAHMVNNLRSFSTAKEMWDYLQRIYHQDNTARRFQLQLEISNFSQGNLSIEQYYSGFINLWSEYSGIVYSKVPNEALASLRAIHEDSRRDQFLMKLRPEFEITRAGLLNRNPVPSLDICLGELLREEQRMATQAVLGSSKETSEIVNVAYAAQGKNRGKGQMQCYSCKEFGHIARNCGKKFCNYCKQNGHIIKQCPTRPENRQGQAFQAAISEPTNIRSTATIADTNQSFVTPEMVQQMIITAFSTLGLQGQSKSVSSPWFVDSGASNHMTGSPDWLHNLRKYTGKQNIQIANGSNLPITAIGDIGPSFRHVFVSPGLSTSLISVGQLVDNNCNVNFSRCGCLVQDQGSGKVIARGPKVGRLFPLQFIIPRTLSLASIIIENKAEVWHKRLGHPNNVILSHLMKQGFLGNQCSSNSLSLDCSVCKLGKSKVLPFPTYGTRANICFEIIHSDVWGVTPIISHAQYKYFVTFIDDYSRFTWIYFLRTKAEVLTVFRNFVAYIETQFSTSIKVLRSDNGGEYMSHDFQAFLQQKGIISQRSCPYTPQQNGVAERKNRHLLDMVRTLLLEASVPPRFWVEALSTAVYLINRLPSQQLNFDSPYFRLFGMQPDYHMLHTFGCVCFVHLPSHERHKLTAQSVRCAFMGYSTTHKGFLCYDAATNRLRVSRNVIFFEHEYYFQQQDLPSHGVLLPSFDDISPSFERFKPGFVYQRRQPPSLQILPDPDPVPTSVALRRSNRISRPPDSENAGLLASTRVGSRRVVQISAGFMLFFSVLGKFGAIFASIPVPIFTALYCLFFAYVGSAGLSFLQFCNLNSFRTKFILGFSVFMGLSVPQYFNEYTAVAGYGPVHTRARWFNDIINVTFSSEAFVAGFVAFFLDNTLHRKDGTTRKDRGYHWWDKFRSFKSDPRSEEFYALPFNLNKFFPSV